MSSTFCRPAQEHLFISSQGYLAPCCFIKDAKDRLSDIDDPIDWFYNNSSQTQLRDNLNSGQADTRCAVCWVNESKGKWSLRTNDNGKNYAPEPPNLKLLHIVGGRLCNLACRMCYADLSSLVQMEQRPWELSKTEGKNYNWIDQETNINKLVKLANLHSLQELQLQGGEPQLIRGFQAMLEQIPDDRKRKLQVQVTSNATIFNEKFWREIAKFENIIIGLSIDAIGDRYNAIRYHGEWSTTEKNFREICKYLSMNRKYGFSLNLNIVHQLANLDQSTLLSNFIQKTNNTFDKCRAYYTLMPIGDNPCWDLNNVPVEILEKQLGLMLNNTRLEKEYTRNISNAIKYNQFKTKHAQEVLKREKWFKQTRGINLWNTRPDWWMIYKKHAEPKGVAHKAKDNVIGERIKAENLSNTLKNFLPHNKDG